MTAAALSRYARIWESATRPETHLLLIRAVYDDNFSSLAADLRHFACWCARDAGAAAAGEIPHRVLHAAEKFAAGTLSAASLAAEKRAADGLPTNTGAIGIGVRTPLAALQLAAVTTATEDPLEAARLAAHFPRWRSR